MVINQSYGPGHDIAPFLGIPLLKEIVKSMSGKVSQNNSIPMISMRWSHAELIIPFISMMVKM